MLSLFPQNLESALFIGAHCDDIEIGCGATILQLAERYPELSVHWVVLSSNSVRAQEARRSAELFLSRVKTKVIDVQAFRNGYFPYVGAEIKDYFEALKKRVTPDLVFTQYGQDKHQDHRVTSELTWNTFRDHFILEYEIPKYDGESGSPNLFVPSSFQHCEQKVANLMNCFGSEANKHWFTRDTFTGLMRLRGVECNAGSGYAEAFYCRKAVLGSS